MTRVLVRCATTVVLVLLALAAGGCGGAEPGDSSATTTSAAAVRPAPDFAGTTLDGTAVSLASFKGKPLLLVFWASW